VERWDVAAQVGDVEAMLGWRLKEGRRNPLDQVDEQLGGLGASYRTSGTQAACLTDG
jgi:hypothetical protein